jgi:hypothetical protein
MKQIFQVCGYVIFCGLAVGIAIGLVLLGNRIPDVLNPMPRTVKVDCSIAEISPDIPVWIKEECRKLKSEKSKNGN